MLGRLTTVGGRELVLGPELGRGGEGIVFALENRPNEAIKIYHPEKPIPPERRRKLHAMVKMCTPGLTKHAAWPIDLVEDRVFGVVMPKVTGIEIHDVFGPKSRIAKLPDARFKFLLTVAFNLCVALDEIHRHGLVVGDFNQRNILVGKTATASFVDCDSFQVRNGTELFRCVVGVPDHLAPEAQDKDLERFVREPDHDNFTLAVLIFQLLFLGRHPYAGVGGPDVELHTSIKSHHFAYGKYGASAGIKPPNEVPPLKVLPAPMIALFERAFAPPIARITRPTPADWAKEIKAAIDRVVVCRLVSSHEHVAGISTCPWCDLYNKFQLNFFNVDTLQMLRTEARTILDLIEKLLQAEPPRSNNALPATVAPKPFALPANAATPSSIHLGAFVLVSAAAFSLFYTHWLVAVAIWGWGLQIAFKGNNQATASLLDSAKGLLAKAENAQRAIQASMQSVADSCAQEFSKHKARVRQIKHEYENLPNERNRRISDLNSKQAQLQLDQYLDSFFVEDATIMGVGPRRKDILLSYGVETAKDVRPGLGIPGFGSELEGNLMAWKTGLAQRFKFDPSRSVSPAEIQKIDLWLLARKAQLETDLRSAKDTMESLSRRAQNELHADQANLAKAVQERLQAQSDIAAISTLGKERPAYANPAVYAIFWPFLLLVLIGVVSDAHRKIPVSQAPSPSEIALPTPVAPAVKPAVLILTANTKAEFTLTLVDGGEATKTVNTSFVNGTHRVDVGGLSPGNYRITAGSPRWTSMKSTEITLASGEERALEAQFKTSTVTITSEPSGAKVHLAGQLLGTTPLTVPDVPAELQKFTFELDGFPPEESTAVLTGDPYSLRHVWRFGSVVVRSNPEGAEVRRGAKLLGKTPLRLTEIAAGEIDLTLSHPEFEPQSVRGYVETGKLLNLSAALIDSRPGKIQIEPKPDRQLFEIKNTGARQLLIHRVEVNSSSAAAESFDFGISLRPGEAVTVSPKIIPTSQTDVVIVTDAKQLEVNFVTSPPPTPPAPPFPLRSIQVLLDTEEQTLRVSNSGNSELLVKAVLIQAKERRTTRRIEVNKRVPSSESIMVKIRARIADGDSVQFETNPMLPAGTIVFSTSP